MGEESFELKPLLKWTLQALNTNGCDPIKKNWGSKFRYAASFFNYTAMITLSLLEVFLNWNGYETISKTELFPNMFQGWCKIICIAYHSDNLIAIIKKLRHLWPEDRCGPEAQAEVTEIHDNVRKFYTYYTLLSTITLTSIVLKPIIYGEKLLLLAAYQYCDYEAFPCYELQYLWQSLFIAGVMFMTIMGFEAMFTCLVVYAIGALKLVKHALRQLNKNTVEEDRTILQRQIKEIVNQHNLVLSLVKDINEVYSTILLIQFWTSLACLTTCLFLLTHNGIPPSFDDLSIYGVLYINLIFQLSIYCAGGTMLMDEALGIGIEAYDIDWWCESKAKIGKDISFMIQRSNKVEKITVGGMSSLNLETYAHVVQNSISVYALLQTLVTD